MHELQDDEFRRTDSSQSDLYDQPAGPYVFLSHCLAQTDMYEEGFLCGGAHQSARLPLLGEEDLDHRLQPEPGMLVIGLEHELLRSILYRLLHHDKEAPDRYITPFIVIT